MSSANAKNYYGLFTRKIYFIFLVSAAVVFYACRSTRGEVNISDTDFRDEVNLQQNLVFRFNKDLYPDSISNKWDSTDYIDFEPEVKGSFRWNNSNELVFSPQKGFQPSTEYKAILTTHLLDKIRAKHSDYHIGDKNTLTFHTAPLRIEQVHPQWTKGKEASDIVIQLDVDFNYPVDLTQAASKLKLNVGGSPVNFNAITSGNGKTVSVQFQPLNDRDEDVDVKADLGNGIRIAGTKIYSQKDTSFVTSVPSRYKLEVTSVNARHDGLQGTVDVTLSQPVSGQDLKSMLQITPSVPFTATDNESGFTITSGSFDAKTNYTLTIKKTIQGAYGGRLKEDYSGQISFAQLAPSISFVNTKGMYLSSSGYRNLALNIVSVPKVELTVIKVYENNLLELFRQGKEDGYSYNEDGDDQYHDYEYYNTGNLGDTVYRRTYDVSKLPKHNAAHLLHLDFADKLKGYDGVYIIKVASADHQWLQESKILSLSDIGLIVKQEQDNIYVFANSIHNATPVSGARISFISTTNQQIYSETTDKDGTAVFDDLQTKAPNFRVGMVTAKSGDEFSFITFNQSLIETSRFDVGGRTVNATGLNAWIYAERDLYRPGETIHTSVVVRDEGWNAPGEEPVKLKLLMPNGKEFALRKKILNEQGSLEADFPVPSSAITGTYVLQVYTGNDVLLNTYDFSVEEFIPDRIKSDLKLNKAEYQTGEAVISTIQADNLFGTPAANRNYEWELNISKIHFQPKGYENYLFDVTKNLSFNTVLRSGSTNAAGQASEQYKLDSSLKETGVLQGNVHLTVFDETGRPVHRYAQFKLFTQPVFFGIRQFNDYVGTHAPLHFNLIALDKTGSVRAENAVVTVIRKEWQSVIEEDGGRYKYVSKWTDKKVAVQDMHISGSNTDFTYTADISGEYELHVALPGSDNYVSQTFYAYGSGDTQYSSFEVNNEGNVTIKADKENYQPGDNISLLFTTPFEGRMLVSVERDKMIEHYFVNTQNKSASLQLKATDAYLPNVYISATLFRPMDGSDMPLTVAHGYQNIKVESKKNKLPVSVAMKTLSRSKTKQTIYIKTAPGAYVTVAAVDEGILQVKNYETPDPYKYFYQKIALGVNSYDVYPLLLPEYKTTSSSTGGDGTARQNSNRVNPMFVNRVKNVSFWSGIVKADGSGTVRYDIDVPQFSGDLRVMAVAYKDKSFGSFDNHMKVADPIVISSALPRFLSPGDNALMPVTLSNTTDKEANAVLSIQTQGAIGIAGAQTKTVTLPPHSEGRAVFDVSAASKIGAGKVVVTVKALSETFTDETDISVRPAASLQKRFNSGIVTAGSSKALSFADNFMPGTFSGSLIIANSPLVQFSKNLSFLIHYPYGCVEQTVSAAFPQLYYADFVKTLTGSDNTDINPNYNVQQAILKLQSMQLSNGALSYWPGADYESWWGSIFAAHFLLEAQKAGFDVNQPAVNRLLDYIRFRLKKKETVQFYYNGNQVRSIVAKEVPYSLYVLALANQPEPSTMNYYKGNSGMLSNDEKYLLAAAFALSGQRDKARQTLPPAFGNEKADPQFGGSFYSYTRDKALSLFALLDIDPENPQVAELALQLSSELQTNDFLNTQENVFSVLALGKIARTAVATTGEAQVTANGRQVASTKGAPVKIDLKDLLNQSLQVKATGKGQFYYFQETEGISTDGSIKEEDKYMSVRREYYNRSGTRITSNTFKQNDLIVVKLTIAAQYRRDIENVVVTDMLPAGLEIENTRLNNMPDLKWVTDSKNKSEPDYMDVRDDRINIFTTAAAAPKTFYYMLRAVSPGTYKLGPVQADAMYNGMFHSYNGAGIVRVTE